MGLTGRRNKPEGPVAELRADLRRSTPKGSGLGKCSSGGVGASVGGMIGSEIQSHAFRLAELRSECARVIAVLGVFGTLLVLVLIRGIASLAAGFRGEAWPFALLLGLAAAYELLWLRFVRQA